MTLSTYKNLIRAFVITTITASVFVGCGDGKTKHRQPIRKNGAGANNKTNGKESAEQQKKNAESLKAKTGKISTIESTAAQLTDKKTPLDKNQLPDGTYQLSSVATYLKYMFQQSDLRAIKFSDLKKGSAGYELVDNNTNTIGMMTPHIDETRLVEMPASIEVKKQGNAFVADASTFKDLLLLSTRVVDQASGSSSVQNILQVNNGSAKASVPQLLQGEANTGAYSVTDEKGRTVSMRILKSSDTKYLFVFDIDEKLPNQTSAKDPGQLQRQIVLQYEFTPAKGTAAAVTPAANEESAQAPAPLTGEQTVQGPQEAAPTGSQGFYDN